MHQPAAGIVRRGAHIFLYVHENVPGIREDAKTPGVLRVRLGRARKKIEPRVVRYTVTSDALRRWTEEGLREM